MTPHLHLAPSATGSRSLATAPIRVVLAEDHALVRRSLRSLLDGEENLTVVAEASDLATAAECVHEHRPHVLVLDLKMPGGSSIETIRRLRQEVPGTEVVVLTMERSPAFAQRAVDVGALGFVLKDRADTELPAAVSNAARGAEFVSPLLAAGLEGLRRAGNRKGLSMRESEVLRLIALGFTSREIADKLDLSRRTVETHRAAIYAKLGLTKRSELVQFALGRDLLGG